MNISLGFLAILLVFGVEAAAKSLFLAGPKITEISDRQYEPALDCQGSDEDYPRFSKIKLISRYSEVHVRSVELLFDDLTSESVEYSRVIHRGRTTQWISLKHEPMCIIGVRVVGESLDRDLDYPQVEVWGK